MTDASRDIDGRFIDGRVVDEEGVARCWWGSSSEDYRAYHDSEWGRPVGDDRRLFEKLCLEGFQSGLSWLTILRKREGFRRAFAGFDHEAMARFPASRVDELLTDTSIVRHRGKIEAALHNARQMADLVDEHGSLAAYVWQFEPDVSTRPAEPDHQWLLQTTTSPEATAMAKDLKKRGWRFVGPTTAYAFFQAMGLVDDHVGGCYVRPAVEAERAAFTRPDARSARDREQNPTTRADHGWGSMERSRR